MEIKSNKLILYINNEPIEVLSGIDLTTVGDYTSCTTEISGEYTFEAGKWEPEYTLEAQWKYNWWMARTLPRKQKKAYRKKLLKMLYGN